MNKTNDTLNDSRSLSEALGIEYIPSEEKTKQEILVPVQKYETNNHAEDDYNLSRTTFRNLIQQGNLALEDMKKFARESESPRAYEVFATMIKTIADTTNNLYDLQKKTKELKDEPKKPYDGGNVTVERAVFVGTTSDLLKKIKEGKNNEIL